MDLDQETVIIYDFEQEFGNRESVKRGCEFCGFVYCRVAKTSARDRSARVSRCS